MADGAAPSGDVAKRIADLNRKLDDANRAVSKAKTVSLVLTFVIIIAAVVGVMTLIWPIKQAIENPEPYKKAMVKEWEDSIQPELKALATSKEIQGQFREIGDLLLKQAGARQEDALVALNGEITTFITNMQEWGEAQVLLRRDTIKGHIETRLKNEIPLLQDPEQQDLILANGQTAMSAAVERVMDEHLGRHIALFLSIENKLNHFPVSEEYTAMSDTELSETITQELGVYASYVFRTSVNPETRGFLRELGEDK